MTEESKNEVTGHLEEQPIDYWEGLEDMVAPENTLERVTALANQAKELAKVIVEKEVALAESQEEYKKIVRVLLPDIMLELGLTELKMDDGGVVGIANKLQTSITEANRPGAFKWLEEHEFDGIIKTKVLAEFGKGEMEDAKKAQKALHEAGFMGSLDRNIHPMTLASFVKERLEAGDKLPPEFNVFEFKEAKITPPKVKKPRKK